MSILSDEVTDDPLTRGYAGMTDQQLVDDLNLLYRDNWITLTSSQIFEVIDPAEFQVLSAADQARVDRVLGLGVDVQTAPGSQSRTEMVAVFPGGGPTLTALVAVGNPKQTRPQELRMGSVSLRTLRMEGIR